MVILVTSSSSSKTEFTCIFYDVFDVGGYAGSSLLEVSLLSCKAYLLCLFLLTSLCFDATRCLVSNKLEFAQFGAHMKKFWQFCFSPCSSTAVAAVVPLVASSGSTAPQAVVPLAVFGRSTAVVPGYYRLDSRPLFFVSGFAVLVAAVVAVVPLQAVVPPVLLG